MNLVDMLCWCYILHVYTGLKQRKWRNYM